MTIIWDHDPEAAETYRIALGGDVVQLQAGPRVSRALEQDASHDLVVIGPDIPLDDACEVAERARVDHPALGVILLRHRLEVGALAQALRSGVREVVQADDQRALADAVRRSAALTVQLSGHLPGSGGAEGKVITVFSAKGGVGKTTLSTNLAAYLASTGATTLLVDLDLMFGDVAISLQLQPHSSIHDLVAMRGHLDAQGLESVVTVHEDSGLHVLAAPADPSDADRVPSEVVLELLRVARSTYTYIVVDTPPSFTEHVLAAFDVSDLNLLIATLDIPAVKNLRVAINTLDALGAAREARRVVLNRADTKVGLSANDVETALKQQIAASVPNSLTVPASVNRGVPIVLHEPRGPVALAIRELGDHEIRQRFGEVLPNGTKRSFSLLRSIR
ncbi:MAG: AAA family ATPase [Intrasporangium sp.]|uniref:AAA family ATPase n=1 Tax=Intrasporangium sp. TaxID=1925024 RepID=UPI0026499B0B|nr:AAA family ATPase [Intrasporangium sp.]MDN5795021.1 AAA family ATPase [Intrasporangium sp.]